MVDGARRPLSPASDVLLRVLDGRKRQVKEYSTRASIVAFKDLPFHDNPDDNYTVFAACSGFKDSAIFPIGLKKGAMIDANLMLIPSDSEFHFQPWNKLQNADTGLLQLLTNGATNPAQRYSETLEAQPQELGALLTIGTAVRDIKLSDGSSPLALSCYWEVLWDHLAPDRFWALVDASMVDRISTLADLGAFAAEPDPGHWHPATGFASVATNSWKQTRFDVCNVQLTFHEGNRAERIDANGNRVQCVLIEPDIDYFKDPLAHGLLEVIPNTITKGKTDPRVVYMLRWMATLQEGLPAFDPPVTLE
jgi:hypothetical protein